MLNRHPGGCLIGIPLALGRPDGFVDPMIIVYNPSFTITNPSISVKLCVRIPIMQPDAYLASGGCPTANQIPIWQPLNAMQSYGGCQMSGEMDGQLAVSCRIFHKPMALIQRCVAQGYSLDMFLDRKCSTPWNLNPISIFFFSISVFGTRL